MAVTMDAKLSSVRTMSDASLATSLPLCPIAMPISACLSAGESFTPSPVMTQNALRRCMASIMRTLVMGLHLAMTSGRTLIPSICASSILSKSDACITTELTVSGAISRLRIPTSNAMDVAVLMWSPVTMCTDTPADLHRRTASAVSRRGGS